MVLDWILAVEPRDLEGRLTLDTAVLERDDTGSTVLWRLRDRLWRFWDELTEPWGGSRPSDEFQRNSQVPKPRRASTTGTRRKKISEKLTNIWRHIRMVHIKGLTGNSW